MRKIGALFLALAFEMERMRKEEGKVPNLAFFIVIRVKTLGRQIIASLRATIVIV